MWLDDNDIDHVGALALAESLSNSEVELLTLFQNSSNICTSELTNRAEKYHIIPDDEASIYQIHKIPKYHEESDDYLSEEDDNMIDF